jgi:hypothetical protein
MKRYFGPANLQTRRVIARWSAFLALVAAIVAYQLSVNAFQDPYRAGYGYTTNFVVQNWGVAFIAAEVFFIWLLKWTQGGVYWFWWLQLQKPRPTAQQVLVRENVYRRAYGIVALVLFFVAPGAASGISHFAQPAQHEIIVRLVWIAGVLFIGLPSILAAWQKDS